MASIHLPTQSRGFVGCRRTLPILGALVCFGALVLLGVLLPFVGVMEGCCEGDTVGSTLGLMDGCVLGGEEGSVEGISDGIGVLGVEEGSLEIEGTADGSMEGWCDGATEGTVLRDGSSVGSQV